MIGVWWVDVSVGVGGCGCLCVWVCARTHVLVCFYDVFRTRYILDLTPGSHFCWACCKHLHLVLHPQPREGQENQLPLPAHAGVCRPPGSHCICPCHQKHTDRGETAYLYHHAVYRHGNSTDLWRPHHACTAVPQDTVSCCACSCCACSC